MTTEREMLHNILRREGDMDGREYHIAQAILAAGFRLVTPTSEGEAQKAARLLLDLEPVNFTAHGAQEAAKICARYILSLAPGKDVVEGARKIAEEFCGSGLTGADKLASAIAAIASAHAAREREAVLKFCEQIMGRLDEHDAAMFAPEFAAIRSRTP